MKAIFQKFALLLFIALGGPSAQAELFCSLGGASGNCGNLACEPAYGETRRNCPIDCSNSSLGSYNGQVFCEESAETYAPSNAGEVAWILTDAANRGKSVRFVGGRHSQTSLFCSPDVMIVSENLDRILGLRELRGESVVDVQPGVRLGALEEWLHEKGLTLGLSVPNFPWVTIAGAVSTASHGSSRLAPSSLVSSLRETQLVAASGRILTIGPGAPEWSAVQVGLGSLGFLSRLSLRVYPQFNLTVKTTEVDADQLLGRYPEAWPVPCDTETYFWFPRMNKALRFCGTRTEQPVDPDAMNTILLQKAQGLLPEESLRQALHLSRCSTEVACFAEWIAYLQLRSNPPFRKRDERGELKPSHEVTGYSHRMVTSSFPDPTQRFTSIVDWSFAIAPEKVSPALRYIDWYARSENLCFPIGGITLRFVKDDGALLSPFHFAGSRNREPAVMLEFVVYDPQRIRGAARERMDRDLRNLVTDLIALFGVRPHWGKNMDWALEAAVGAGNFGRQFEEFSRVRRSLDPGDRFGNPLTRKLLRTPD